MSERAKGTNEPGTLNHIHATVKIGQRRGALAGMSVMDPHGVDGSHLVKPRRADQEKDGTVTGRRVLREFHIHDMGRV